MSLWRYFVFAVRSVLNKCPDECRALAIDRLSSVETWQAVDHDWTRWTNRGSYRRYIVPLLRMILAASLFLVSVLPLRAATVCADPAFLIKPGSDILLLHQIFDAGQSSRRHFTEVHYDVPGDPNLTVGMGHWIEGNLAGLFQRLKRDQESWSELTRIWASTLNTQMWRQFERDTNVKGRDSDAISSGLTKLLCANDASGRCVRNTLEPWSHRTATRFNSPDHWFNAGWLKVSILRKIAEHQVRHWTETIVAKGQQAAAERDLVTLGGIASVISAKSSSLGGTMFRPNTQVAEVRKKQFSRSLVRVPDAARPLTAEIDETALLEDWRSLVAWQFYTVKKGKVRSRMRAIWELFYESAWGPLPASRDIRHLKKLPRHTGCYMPRGKFRTEVLLATSDELDCSPPIPKPEPLPCVRKP